MKWLKVEDVQHFLTQRNYDIRQTHNGRWIDQKCTADVLTLVADCVLEYTEANPKKVFWRKDIQLFDYTMEYVKNIFKKPGTDEPLAENEYDKFFSQPLELLAYAGILSKVVEKKRNYYAVLEPEMLQFIALRERNSLTFLQNYITKVLSDSNTYSAFGSFFENPSKDSYDIMRQLFFDFTQKNTPINGDCECGRIFTKVLNPLAYLQSSKGTEKGRMSKDVITFDMLMYNRDNFRDIYLHKPKGMTRKQYASQEKISLNTNYFAYLAQKAKKVLRSFNDEYRASMTEVIDDRHIDDVATHMHHIFPQADFPEICFFLENLIALTPTQHINYAHPDGKTNHLNRDYQYVCIVAKAASIKENIEDKTKPTIYEFSKFVYVLSVGLDEDSFDEIDDLDFESVLIKVNSFY